MTGGAGPNLALLVADAVLVAVAYFCAAVLRFAFDVPDELAGVFKATVAAVVVFKLLVFLLFRLYRVIWRHIGMIDLFNVVKANGLASVCLLGVVFDVDGLTKDLAAIVIVDSLLAPTLMTALRVGIRLVALSIDKKRDSERLQTGNARRRKIVIIGAGAVGEKILREIRDNGKLRYDVVGFLDDDPNKIGLNIHGKSVLGGVDQLGEIAQATGVAEVIIAVGGASGKQMRRIVKSCERYGLPSRTIPVVGDLLNGQVSVSRFRPVAYEDLLGRPPVALDRELIDSFLQERTILVTGGGGSIGSELCRQVSHFQPKALVICDNSENNLYQVEVELRQAFAGMPIHAVLADTRNQDHMREVFRRHRPTVVIHAAAYKHVPMMELYPWEAVKNNVIATLNLMTLAEEQNSDRFVLVSTDKAVRPCSVMGATKRVAELLSLALQTCARTTRFIIVRFGNVAGSEGSVIPLFKKQIERGGPVTVTHPDITRYFMTLPEAAQLILQAGAMGQGGEIFILDMGRPIRILDMARDLIRLSGLEPDEDIEIKFTGLRPGEKLYEELVTEGEGIVPTTHEKILMVRGQARDLHPLETRTKELLECAERRDADGIRKKLREIVPEYSAYPGVPAAGEETLPGRQ